MRVEVLRGDLVEELAEALDLVLLLGRHGQPDLVEDLLGADDPTAGAQRQRDRVRRAGTDLDAIDRGMEPPPVDPVVPTVPKVALAADGLPSAESFTRRDQLRLSRHELLKIADISEDLLDQLEQFGLITQLRGTGHYDTDALVIAQTARELADYGFEPRHLRAFKTAADREVGLVEQVVAPQKRSRDAAAKARAEETVSEIAALSVRLHATLVKTGLRQA